MTIKTRCRGGRSSSKLAEYTRVLGWEALVANLRQLMWVSWIQVGARAVKGAAPGSLGQLCQSRIWNKTDQNGSLSLHLPCYFSAWVQEQLPAEQGARGGTSAPTKYVPAAWTAITDHHNVCQMQMLNELCAPNSLTGSQLYRSAAMVTEIQMHFTRRAWRNALC